MSMFLRTKTHARGVGSVQEDLYDYLINITKAHLRVYLRQIGYTDTFLHQYK